MRIFYAVTFTLEEKNKIERVQRQIKTKWPQSKMVRPVNFHLTLEFIGEVTQERLSNYKNILHHLASEPITLSGTYIGGFQKRSQEILWLGIAPSPRLNRLQTSLLKQLETLNHTPEHNTFHPHITLARKVRRDSQEKIRLPKTIDLTVASIALMESTRKNGQLLYQAIDQINCCKGDG